MLADIRKFESLMHEGSCSYRSNCAVFNSGAAVILERFDLMLRGKLQCDEWIEGLQNNKDLPADLAGQLFASREACSEELLRIKQQLMDEIQKSPLDAYDREVFASLSDAAKKELQPFIQADEVLSRAAEMEEAQKAPQAAPADAQKAVPAPPAEEQGGVEEETALDFSDAVQAEEE